MYVPRYSIQYIVSRDGLICHWCDQLVALSEVSRDHIIPRHRGGPNCLNNYVVTHSECNNARGNIGYLEYCEKLGRKPDQEVILRTFHFNPKCGHCNMRAQKVRREARKQNKKLRHAKTNKPKTAKQRRREQIMRRLEELNILPDT